MTATLDRPATPRQSTARSGARAGGVLATVATVGTVGVLLGLHRAERPYADGDVLWGVRSGLDILRTGTLPHTDAYSWTAHGTAWTPNSWGWNVVLALAYRTGGTVAIALLGTVLIGLVGVLVGVAARRRGAPTAWSVVVLQLVGSLLGVFLYARPQVVDYVAIAALPLLVTGALDAQGRRWPAWLAALGGVQAVWMNLHTAALLGPCAVLALVAGRAWTAPRTTRRRIVGRGAALTAATGLACLATPYGVTPVLHAKQVRDASAGLIAEWAPAGIGSVEQLLALVTILLGLLAAWLAWRAGRRDTVLLLVLLGAGTALALRFAPMLAIAALPELAAGAGRLPVHPTRARLLAVATPAFLAALCIAGAGSFGDPGAQNTSPTLVARLPHDCRLVNDITVGGAVILHRPDVLVSIDSRNDMYGRAAELRALAVERDPRVGPAFVARHHVTCVLDLSAAPLVRALRTMPGWRVAGTDATRTLLVRTP